MIPSNRLGKSSSVEETESYHKLFHFIITTKHVNWKMIRSVEYVFYHHPNAQVMIHCKFPDLVFSLVKIFVEVGYDLVIRSYDIEQMLRDLGERGDVASRQDIEDFIGTLPILRKGQYWYSHGSDILRYLVIYIHGGVYFDIDVYCFQTLEKADFKNVLGEEDKGRVNGSVMILEPQHVLPKMALRWIFDNYNEVASKVWPIIGPDLITKLLPDIQKSTQPLKILGPDAFQPLMWDKVDKRCFQVTRPLKLTDTVAIHLNNKEISKYVMTNPGTPCDEVLHKYCIFCHEIHTNFTAASLSRMRKVVTFPGEG